MESNIVEYKGKLKGCYYCRNVKAHFFDTVKKIYLCRNLIQNCPSWRKIQEVHLHKCFYCKRRQATHYFPTADRYCCNSNYRKCPAIYQNQRKKAMERYYNSPTNILKREIRDGKHKCIYCGMVGNYLIASGVCCEQKARSCPGYKVWLRKRMLKKYQDNPELIERMREISREVHNRPEVIEAKSEKMLHLHRDDCKECENFQGKFLRAHARRRVNNERSTEE